MSLFDVIRYPISNPATLEELHAISNPLKVEILKAIQESGVQIFSEEGTALIRWMILRHEDDDI